MPTATLRIVCTATTENANMQHVSRNEKQQHILTAFLQPWGDFFDDL